MFDLGASELLLIVIVAIIVIGPKDMPTALRAAGRWIGKMRRLSGHFRTGLDAMIREAEMEEMEKKWKAQNEKIMRDHPDGDTVEMEPTGALPPPRKDTKVAKPTEEAPSPVSAESVPVEPASVEPLQPGDGRDEPPPPPPAR